MSISLRCLLFVPGARPERFEKALAAGPDMICIDLEDAVLPAQKDQARRNATDFLNAFGNLAHRIIVRINAIESEWGQKDAAALARLPNAPALVMLPKVTSGADMQSASKVLAEGQGLLPLLESPAAILNADAIAGSSDACRGLMFGGADFSVEMGCGLDWDSLLAARGYLAMVAAKHAKILIDVPYLDVSDPVGLESETRRVKALGFTAKAAIHPSQVAPIQTVFSPSAEEVARASRIISAFESAGGKGAILVDGRLVDRPVVLAAGKVLAASRVQQPDASAR